jgi:hypothetical protein
VIGRLGLAMLGAIALGLGAMAGGSAAYTSEQGLAALNSWRAEAGEPPVTTFLPEWDEGCRLHDEYEALNGGLTHEEQPGNPGYTERGAEAGRRSVLSTGELLPREAWADAVYHREQTLAPRLRVSGYATARGFTCLRTIGGEFDDSPPARTPRLTAYPWPPDGATGVPLGFPGGETPSPYELVPDASRLGYLLSVDFNGPWPSESPFAQSQISAASLVADDGASIPLAIDDANTGYSLGHGSPFGLFPVDPLAPCVWYTAAATGTAYPNGTLGDTYPIAVSWRFQTSCSEREAVVAIQSKPHIGFARVRLRRRRLEVRLRIVPATYPFAAVDLLAVQGLKSRRLPLSRTLKTRTRLASGKWMLVARAAEIRHGRRVWFLRSSRRVSVPPTRRRRAARVVLR